MAKKNVKLNLPPAIGAYVNLFRPQQPPAGSQGKPRYGLVLVYDKTERAKLADFEAKVLQVAEERWPGKGADIVKKMRYPVVADGDERYPEDPTFKGKNFIRASTIADPTRRPPDVVNSQVEKVLSDDDAYSGCTYIANVTLFPFDKAGNKGVGVGLNMVQVVKKGPRMDGRGDPNDTFAAQESADDDVT